EPEWIRPPVPEVAPEEDEFGEPIPETGQPELPGIPIMETEVPSWMPRPDIDNVQVWRSVLANWAKSDEFSQLDPEAQKATMLVFSALRDIEQKEAQQKVELQNQLAETQGMANASRPQTKVGPSLPSVGGESGEGPKELGSGA